MYKKKKVSNFILIIVIIGVLLSSYILISSFLSNNSRTITLLSDDSHDAGYIMLKRNDATPSVLDNTRFNNNETFLFFSLSNNEIKRERVFYYGNSDGRKFVDYEIVYVSGKREEGTIVFR